MRLRPLSSIVPKPLVPILNRPLICHILHKLKKSGITEVGINTHYHAGRIRSCISENMPGMPVYYSHEPQILGTGGGIGGFRSWLKDSDYFIVHNGDILSNIALEPLMALCRSERLLGALALHDHPPHNNVGINTYNHIVDLRNTLTPPGLAATLAYAGIACLSTELLTDMPAGPGDLIPVLLRAVLRRPGSICAYIPEAPAWCDIGSAARYHRAHRDILVDKCALVESRIIPKSRQHFGPGCAFGRNVRFEGFIAAGSSCTFGDGAYLNNAVIWDNARIQQNARITNAVIGDGWIEYV